MKLTQRFALGSALIIAVTVAASLFLRRQLPQHTMGTFSPVGDSLTREVVGTVDPAGMVSGGIIGFADDGTDVFLLQNRAWLRVGPRGTNGPFGVGSRGNRGVITSAAAIAVHDSVVYVLDRGARALQLYARDGSWRGKVPLTSQHAPPFTAEQLVVNDSGHVLVVGLRFTAEGKSERLILAGMPGSSLDTLAVVASPLFHAVVPAQPTTSKWDVVESMTYRIRSFTTAGHLKRRVTREHAPRFPLPDTMRRVLTRYTTRYRDGGRQRPSVPDYLPYVYAAAALSNGDYLVAVISSIDSAWVERIDSLGRPQSLLTPVPVGLPIGVSKHGIIVIQEKPDVTVVERLRKRERLHAGD